MEAQSPQSYFMEFVVISINKPSKRKNQRINYSNNLLVKLVMQCDDTVLGQSFDLARTQAVQNTIKCIKCSLSLELIPSHEQQYWKLVIFGRQSSALDSLDQRLDFSQSESSGRKEMRKMGECEINPNIYAEVFNECEKVKFQENIQLNNNLSIDYEVFIHRSREVLDDFIRSEQNNESVEMVDMAFKKRPGSKKIRYVEFKENRQTSMNSSEFSLAKKPPIASLKKNGMKYVPYKRQSINSNIGERRGREGYQLNRTKPLSSDKGRIQKAKRRNSAEGPKEAGDSVRSNSNKTINNKGTWNSRSYISWQGMIVLILLVLVASFMMFPSRKI